MAGPAFACFRGRAGRAGGGALSQLASVRVPRGLVAKWCAPCAQALRQKGLGGLILGPGTPAPVLAALGLAAPALRGDVVRLLQNHQAAQVGTGLAKQGNVQQLIDTFDEWAGGSWQTCVDTLRDEEGITDPEALCGWLKSRAKRAPAGKAAVSKVIREREGQFCVLTEDESRVLGCHDTMEEAQAQLAAVEANKAGIAKADAAHQQVFGWANVAVDEGEPVVDLQGEEIPPEELEQAMYRYAKDYRTAGVLHAGAPQGILIESVVFTPEKVDAMLGPLVTEGVLAALREAASPADAVEVLKQAIGVRAWVGFQVTPELFAKVRSGELPAFSIQGSALEEPVYA